MAAKPFWRVRAIDREEWVFQLIDTEVAQSWLKGGRVARVSKENYLKILEIERRARRIQSELAAALFGVLLIILSIVGTVYWREYWSEYSDNQKLYVMLAITFGSFALALILWGILELRNKHLASWRKRKLLPLIANTGAEGYQLHTDPYLAERPHQFLVLVDGVWNKRHHEQVLQELKT